MLRQAQPDNRSIIARRNDEAITVMV